MEKNEKYIAPESEEIMIVLEGCVAVSNCEGYTEGDHGCTSDDCPKDY